MTEELCKKDVGYKPWWMSEYQYDPCPCILNKDHDDDCMCKHMIVEVIDD